MKDSTTAVIRLRQMAEARLEDKPPVLGFKLSEPEILRLYHELQVHQVELELINDELLSQNLEKDILITELILKNRQLLDQNQERENQALRQGAAHSELHVQNKENAK